MQTNKGSAFSDIDVRSCTDVLYFCLTKHATCSEDLFAKEVAKEVGSIKKHLESGLKFYKPLPRGSNVDEKYFKDKRLTDDVTKLLSRLCDYLRLESSVGYTLFLQHISRDSSFSNNALASILKSNHATSEFLKRVRCFYREERLSLLSMLALSLIDWDESPLADMLFAATGKQTRVQVAEMIIDQYEAHCASTCDSDAITSKPVNEDDTEWENSHVQHFLEHVELLKALLIASISELLEPKHFSRLMTIFRSNTLASRSTRYSWSVKNTDLLDQLAMYQFLICIQACQCHSYCSLASDNKLSEHPMSSSSRMEELDKLVVGLDDRRYMSPFLLLTSLCHLAYGHSEKANYARRAIREFRVFDYLRQRLETIDNSLQVSANGGGNLELSTLIDTVYCLVYDFLVLLLQCVHIDSLCEERDSFIILLCKVLPQVVPMTGPNSRSLKPLVPVLEDLASEFPHSLAFVNVCAALATENKDISKLVTCLLENMSVFSESYEEVCSFLHSDNFFRPSENRSDEYIALKDRRPYKTGAVVIPRGTKGYLRGNLITWRFSYDFWEVINCEVKVHQHQVRGLRVWSRLRQLFEFCRVWMNSGLFHDRALTLTRSALQIARTLDHAHSNNEHSAELAASRLTIALQLAALQLRSSNAEYIVEQLIHAGLVPVVRRLNDVSSLAFSVALESSLFEEIHNTYERRFRIYPVTEAYLEMCLALIPPSGFNESNLVMWASRAPLLIAAIYFMAHGLLARLQEERAAFLSGTGSASHVIALVRHCLLFFTEFLTRRSRSDETSVDENLRAGSLATIQELCIVSLISPSVAECLIALTSVKVEFLETRRHVTSSTAVEPALSRVVWLALTLVGQLLDREEAQKALLRRMEFSGGPPGHHYFRALLSYLYWEPPPSAATQRGPPLAAMALSVLRRVVQLSALPVLPCLGEAAESLRKVFLRRLAAWSEDDGLRAVQLDLLSEAVVSGRPGLLHLMARTSDEQGQQGAEEDCVACVHALLERRKECSPGLQLALFKFFDSVWQAEATAVTRRLAQCPRGDHFWRRLEEVVDDCLQRDPKQIPNITMRIQVIGHIFSLMAMETYQKKWTGCDPKCQETLRHLLNEKVFIKWLELLNWSISSDGGVTESLMAERLSSAEMCFSRGRLLFLVLLRGAPPMQETPVDVEMNFLTTLMSFYETLNNYECAACQPELTAETLSLLTIFIHRRINRQKSDVAEKLLDRMVLQLSITRAKTEVAYSSHMDLLSSITQLVQQVSLQQAARSLDDNQSALWDRLLTIACNYVNLLTLKESLRPSEEKILSHSLVLLANLVSTRPRAAWSTYVAHSLNNILFLLQACLSTGTRPHLALHVLLLLHAIIGQNPEEAQTLATYDLACLLNFASSVCLSDASDPILVAGGPTPPPTPAPAADKSLAASVNPLSPSQVAAGASEELPSWAEVAVLALRLVTFLLHSLGRAFFPKAAAFFGAQWWTVLGPPLQRWLRSLAPADLLLSEAVLHLVWGLSEHRQLWPLYFAPQLMASVSAALHTTAHRCTALLLRPKLLQHQLECGVGARSAAGLDTPVELRRELSSGGAGRVGEARAAGAGVMATRARQRQRSRSNSSRASSVGPLEADLETGQPRVRRVEYWLFRLLTVTLSTFNRISPRVSELVGQPGSEMSELGTLVHPGFSTPGLQEEEDARVSMGVLVSVVHLTSKLLSKAECRSSPVKSSSSLCSDDVTITKTMMIHCQEETLSLLMSQAVLMLNSSQIAPLERQNLYRELSAELTSFLSSTGRHLRRSGVKSPAPPELNRSFVGEAGDAQRTMHRCVENFLKTVVK